VRLMPLAYVNRRGSSDQLRKKYLAALGSRNARARIHPLAICALLFAASVCFTTPLALARYHLIELPFIRLGRGFVKLGGMRAARAI
jgi:peptidoglycan/LPS O-acetylase OafA/YrhL